MAKLKRRPLDDLDEQIAREAERMYGPQRGAAARRSLEKGAFYKRAADPSISPEEFVDEAMARETAETERGRATKPKPVARVLSEGESFIEMPIVEEPTTLQGQYEAARERIFARQKPTRTTGYGGRSAQSYREEAEHMRQQALRFSAKGETDKAMRAMAVRARLLKRLAAVEKRSALAKEAGVEAQTPEGKLAQAHKAYRESGRMDPKAAWDIVEQSKVLGVKIPGLLKDTLLDTIKKRYEYERMQRTGAPAAAIKGASQNISKLQEGISKGEISPVGGFQKMVQEALRVSSPAAAAAIKRHLQEYMDKAAKLDEEGKRKLAADYAGRFSLERFGKDYDAMLKAKHKHLGTHLERQIESADTGVSQADQSVKRLERRVEKADRAYQKQYEIEQKLLSVREQLGKAREQWEKGGKKTEEPEPWRQEWEFNEAVNKRQRLLKNRTSAEEKLEAAENKLEAAQNDLWVLQKQQTNLHRPGLDLTEAGFRLWYARKHGEGDPDADMTEDYRKDYLLGEKPLVGPPAPPDLETPGDATTRPTATTGPALPEGWTDEDESIFQAWYAGFAWRYKLNPDPDDPQHQYDYRAAYRAGAKPDAQGHWPSKFKMEGHPNRVIEGIDTRTGQPAETPAEEPAEPPTGTTPEDPLPLPASPTEAEPGRYYVNAEGRIAKWNGKEFEPIR